MARKGDGKVGHGAFIPKNAKVPGGCLIASIDMAAIAAVAVTVAKVAVTSIRKR